MAAPFDAAQLDESEKNVLNIAIDGRTRIRPSVHLEAMGSRFLSFIQVEHPIKEILESDNLTALCALGQKYAHTYWETFKITI
ncbi:uncharacterized protein CLUP02_18356 [Colletotrichum lupini]|uniref:Uncharacterized protein n=1 Tax=Colletotrichum lupini TaxID=145971 RepID=A0A9Q8SH71_9PEZI|nr:uncharacterized protein CLUP02_18356 [Colletotrichum lupini]UQC76841.1 hypothetical protein CLUP02_18356 [Colletotrichum lupini]